MNIPNPFSSEDDSEKGVPDDNLENETHPQNSTEEAATLAPSSSANHGTVMGKSFGDYELVHEIARGGMGVVYKAVQQSLNRTVAIKMILAGELASEEDVRRFYAEAESAANLDHNHIVPIYEIGTQGETHYYSMKFIEGTDLGKQLKELRSDLPKAVELIEKSCRAIHHAHQRGILHRDLKPGNILIDELGEPYITDFGLVRKVDADSNLTRTGAVIGTPSYMPPEQATGSSDITVAADVYSMGAILYELLTGQPPFRGSTPMDTLMQVINDQPERPSVSGSVDRGLELVALKCLSKNPKERYATAEALAEDLGRWLRGEPLTIRAPSFGAIAKNWMRQNFGRAGWILVVGLICGVTAGLGLWIATAQTEGGQTRRVYSQLRSVDEPFTLMPWDTPAWASIPSMLLFALSISLMGYFTAYLARTKNRSADLAAGVVVGIIAGASAFFVCFGTLSIIATVDDGDLQRLAMLGTVKLTETPEQLLDVYPEFSEFTRKKQVELLTSKISVDRMTQVPWAIMIGTICCLVLFLSAGIVETLVAGPAVRKYPNMWKSLAAYLFCSLPFAVTTIVVGIYFAASMVLGDSGIIWNGLTILTFVIFVIGIIAELRKWNLFIRVPIVAMTAIAFAAFFVFSFQLIPAIGRSRADIKRMLALAERHPENQKIRLNAVQNLLTGGKALYEAGQLRSAEREFRKTINYIKETPASQRSAEMVEALALAYDNRAFILKSLGRESTADELLVDAANENLKEPAVVRRVMAALQRNKKRSLAKQILEKIEITDPESWRQVRRETYLFATSKQGFTKIDRDVQETTIQRALSNALERSKLDENLKTRLQSTVNPQRWYLLRPAQIARREAVQQQMVELAELDLKSVKKRNLTWKTASPFDPLGVDLVRAFPHAPAKTAALAIGSIQSSDSKPIKIWFGSDDGAEVWVNGKKVFGAIGSRPFAPRSDLISCDLRAGENIVVVRINQVGGNWAFGMQLEDIDGWPATVNWNQYPKSLDD